MYSDKKRCFDIASEKFIFAVWILVEYLCNFSPYGSKSINTEGTDFGLGEQVILGLLSVVEHPSNHRVFFDNFFSSHELCLKEDWVL